jgi:ABC-2 type transport system ATP-binding protein
VIALQNVSARRRPWAIKNITVEWGPGVHAVVGTPADGGPLVLAVIVGAARPHAGRARVLDAAPTDPHARPQIARVGVEPSLPDALRVDEALALAADLRGEARRAPAERLSVLGLEGLAPRPIRSLTRGEARGVALAEALSSSRVRVLVVEEPFGWSDPRAASRISEALRDKGRGGAAVVIATASLRDAGELADDSLLMNSGVVVGKTTSLQSLAGLAAGGARLTVVARDSVQARGLVAALANDPTVTAVELDVNRVRVRGTEPLALAQSCGRAAVEAGVDVVEIRSEPLSLDEARAAVTASGTP